MKKLFSMLFITAMLGLVFTACGDDKDEPEVPKTANLESVHADENDNYFVFDIDMTENKGTIIMHNMQFAPGAPVMTLRVNVPVSMNSSGDAYIMRGSSLVVEMFRGGVWVPMPGENYQLNNLMCTVNPKAKTYDISFDSHGGHFEESGKLQ